MKTIIVFLVAFFAFSFVCDSFAQEDSKDKKKNKNKDKSKITITVDSKEFPKSLEPSGVLISRSLSRISQKTPNGA